MSRQSKILLACPTSDYKLYCQEAWINHIKKLTYNVDILIVDNSKTKDNYNYFKSKGINCIYHDPKNHGLKKILSDCLNTIKDYVLENDYDYWFSLESDHFPDLNIIELLLCFDLNIVGVPYFHFSGEKTVILNTTYTNIAGEYFGDFMSLEQSFSYCDGGLKKFEQCGIGCMLVHRSIFEQHKIIFREGVVGEYGYFKDGLPDFYFHLDLQKHKIPVYLYTGTFSVHRNDDKKWNEILKKKRL